MPLYEFKCHECKDFFEMRLPVEERDADITCPKCGGKGKRVLPVLEQIWLTVGRAKKTTYPPSEVE